MLGKALYEGILLDLPLAGFFLKKFRTQHCDVSMFSCDHDPHVCRAVAYFLSWPESAVHSDQWQSGSIRRMSHGSQRPQHVLRRHHSTACLNRAPAVAAPDSTSSFLRG